MKKIFIALLAFVLFSSHVMYLKLEGYFLEPNTAATIQLFNGTFDKSENVITRDRMLDASLLGNGQRIKVKESQWTEKDSITLLNFQTGEAGTWVAGISTAPRGIEMDAEAFNSYLEHEGILDMIDWRRENHKMDSSAVEKYSKHVKTIFQVGDKKTNDWQKALGYPIEFIPLDNPYELHTGDSLRVKLLLNGVPLANQLVYANFKAPEDGHTHGNETGAEHTHNGEGKHEHSHDTKPEETPDHDKEPEKGHSHDSKTGNGHSHSHDGGATQHSHETETSEADQRSHTHKDGSTSHTHAEETQPKHSHSTTETQEHSHDANDDLEPHTHTSGQQMRTDANGVVVTSLSADGIWYLQTIHLVETDEENYTHESNWTTLTFEVAHAHGEDTHTHEEGGIPSYVYWISSILLIGLLFFWFNRKN